MANLRQDYLTGEWVLMAEERSDRPFSYKEAVISEDRGIEWCPFCKHNAHLLPPIICESNDGRVKAVPNKYPAIRQPEGFHEVIIDTNIHDENFEDFSLDDMALVFCILKQRRDHLYADNCIQYVQIFKNKGKAAGASVFHSHWQMIGLPFMPEKQKKIFKNMASFFKQYGISYIESLYHYKEYIVYENESFFVYCPRVSIFYKELHIAPKKNERNFSAFQDRDYILMADAIQHALNVYKNVFQDLSYNICFIDSPYFTLKGSHFYIQIIPRIGNLAGFEFSTNCYINSAYPEKTAEDFRQMMNEGEV